MEPLQFFLEYPDLHKWFVGFTGPGDVNLVFKMPNGQYAMLADSERYAAPVYVYTSYPDHNEPGVWYDFVDMRDCSRIEHAVEFLKELACSTPLQPSP